MVPNPRWSCFLHLAVKSVRDINQQRNKGGISCDQKAMIVTCMALNINGRWEERQMRPQLQVIIHKYRDYFNGRSVESGVDD